MERVGGGKELNDDRVRKLKKIRPSLSNYNNMLARIYED